MIAERAPAVAAQLHRYLPITPLVRFGAFSEELGAEVLVKCEHQQLTGSFKARGSLANVLTLSPEQRSRGVVTASTGNHGLGVAHAMSLLGGPCTVFVPENALPTKVAAIRRFGAEIVSEGDESGALEIVARQYAAERGITYVAPYNDVRTIAGQASVGVEMLDQLGSEGLDALFVAVGGGGLVSGVASVLKERFPDLRVYGASPVLDASMIASIGAGHIVGVDARPSLSDGTAGNVEPGSVTFELCRRLVDDWVLVEEADIAAAIRTVIDTEHQLVEGSAGVAVAAARLRREEVAGRRVGVIACGGNISTGALRAALDEGYGRE
jgi:threonine dehydratase